MGFGNQLHWLLREKKSHEYAKIAGEAAHNKLAVSANEIIPGLWLGNYAAASSPEWIAKHRITMIINVTKGLDRYYLKSSVYKGCKVYHVHIYDPGDIYKNGSWDENMEIMWRVVPGLVEVINKELLNGGRVLVHCRAGVQRSACVVACYLAAMGHSDPVTHIREKRPVAFGWGYSFNFYPVYQKFVDAYVKN